MQEEKEQPRKRGRSQGREGAVKEEQAKGRDIKM
jgi:hypothetical protein